MKHNDANIKQGGRNVVKWLSRGLYQIPDAFPHENPDIDSIAWQGHCLFAQWTDHFDCGEETQFWWVIKDTPFDLSALKAKRRYEITKGNKNFYVKRISPIGYLDALYDVYLESLKGYRHAVAEPRETFCKNMENLIDDKRFNLFAAFHRESDLLCGFAMVFVNGRYIPISSLKTRVSYEKENVNFALVYGILQYFELDLRAGSYLCDGSRTVMHETNFQPFLMKYFGFRKAYCDLHLTFRGVAKVAFYCMFPFRNVPILKKFSPKLYAVLKLLAWSKNLPR